MNTAKKLRLEGRNEGLTIGRNEGLKAGRTEGLKVGRTEGLKMGRSEGIASEKRRIASNLRTKGHSLEMISSILDLPLRELQTLLAANDPVFPD